ncbi:MAG: hydroxyacid dehydrogenase [Aggregatilineales bacterium]
MTYQVLIPDNVNQKAIDLLNDIDGLDVIAPGKIAREDLMAQIADAHALIIRSGVQADAELLNAAANLKAIARAGVGVDNIDLDAATANGIIVMNTPGGNTISTAEHTIGLMLALARHIPQGHQSMSEGRWDRKKYMGIELRGKTLGLIGVGRIGEAVAARAAAFGMAVIAYDPYVKSSDFAELVDLATLYSRADFISLHALVTDETRDMLNADAFAQMKDGVRIINAARGALIHEGDLADALRSGKVAGAALDVYSPEPPADNNPLIHLPTVIHTPHLAASTSDAQVTVAIEAAEIIRDTLLDNKPQNVVNKAVLNG